MAGSKTPAAAPAAPTAPKTLGDYLNAGIMSAAQGAPMVSAALAPMAANVVQAAHWGAGAFSRALAPAPAAAPTPPPAAAAAPTSGAQMIRDLVTPHIAAALGPDAWPGMTPAALQAVTGLVPYYGKDPDPKVAAGHQALDMINALYPGQISAANKAGDTAQAQKLQSEFIDQITKIQGINPQAQAIAEEINPGGK
jgi:hypothetical protein